MGSRLISRNGATMPILCKAIEGDWEMRPDSSPVPVKLTVKQFIGSDWMMACMVREVDGAVKQLKYSITGKEIPVEIMEIETELSQFFEGEIKNIKREGEKLSVVAG